jgi:hypothetical protein
MKQRTEHVFVAAQPVPTGCATLTEVEVWHIPALRVLRTLLLRWCVARGMIRIGSGPRAPGWPACVHGFGGGLGGLSAGSCMPSTIVAFAKRTGVLALQRRSSRRRSPPRMGL